MTSGQMTLLPGHFRSNEVTDIISCHVIASSCELQPCRKWKVQCTRVFAHLQPLTGDFRSNFVTSGSLPVAWGHLTSFLATWLPPPASYSVLESEMYSICEFWPTTATSRWLPVNYVTSGALPVTIDHVKSFPVMWLPPAASDRLVKSEMYSIRVFLAFYSHFQVTSGQITSLPGDFRSPEVTWRHFLPRDCLLLRAIAL